MFNFLSYDKEKEQILTFEKLKPEIILHFCMKMTEIKSK